MVTGYIILKYMHFTFGIFFENRPINDDLPVENHCFRVYVIIIIIGYVYITLLCTQSVLHIVAHVAHLD